MDQSLKDKFVRLQQRHVAPYSILSLEPPIFCLQLHFNALGEFASTYELLFASLKGQKSYCLCCHTWYLTPELVASLVSLVSQLKVQFPDVELIQLCNEPGQAEQLQAGGVQAVFCNHNCFVDEAIFKPLPSIEKRFDAVYNARLVPWKRHLLAEQVTSLALLHYATPGDDPEYARMIRQRLAQAHFLNDSESGSYQAFPPEGINRILNSCQVGLCLSAEEGAMYASMEYLLSGLLVVSTPSQGGREVFFTDGFVLTVPPDPAEISRAVRELAQRELRRDEVRAATLEKVNRHRQRFLALVHGLFDQHQVRWPFDEGWPPAFNYRFSYHTSHLDTIARIEAAGLTRQG